MHAGPVNELAHIASEPPDSATISLPPVTDQRSVANIEPEQRSFTAMVHRGISVPPRYFCATFVNKPIILFVPSPLTQQKRPSQIRIEIIMEIVLTLPSTKLTSIFNSNDNR